MERDFVESIVKSLVDNPDAVNIKVIEGEKSTILELRVAESDVGKVIGKNGRIARAIRTILSACASAQSKRVILEILD
ncbi:MAG: KH domain-containing protein [Rectinema sp.]|nr:KH domain-containing protein [Rectinema sp.]